MKTENIVLIGVGAIAAYYVFKGFGSLNAAADSVAADVGNFWANLTMGPSVSSQLQGQVIMPDGSTFSTSNLTSLGFGFQGNVALFTLNGVQYSLSPHDANGNYVATRV